MRRRLGITAAVTLTLVALGAAAGWLFALPAAIEGRLVEAAARRGLSATVASVDPGWAQVELRGVDLRAGEVASAHLDRVVVRAELWALAYDGLGAVRGVAVRGVRIDADVSHPELGAVFRRLRPAGEGDRQARPTGGPTIDVEGVQVGLRDGAGPIATIADGELQRLASGRFRLAAGETALAPGATEGATAASAELRLDPDAEGGWRVEGLTVRDVRLLYRERDAGAPSPIWDRLREGARSLGAAIAPPTGVDAPGQAPSEEEPSRLARAASLLRAIAPRLAEGASLRLEGLEVVARSAEGDVPVLRELSSEAHALEGGRYRLQGEGQPGRGGRLGWRLLVDPDGLRAEGNVDFQRVPFVLLVPFLPELPWHRPEEATISGDLTIRGDSASRVHLSGEASVEDLAVASPRIAPIPVARIAASFRGEADWHPLSRRLEIGEATIGLGQARAALSGSIEWPEDHYLLDATITLPLTECNAAVGAIPTDLLAEAAGFTFRGRIGGRVVARIDSRALDETRLDIDVQNGCTFVTAPPMAAITRFTGPFVHRVVEPDGTVFSMETGPGTEAWTPLASISPFFVHAVLGHEDGGFFRHTGFSVPSIRLALIRNLTEGRYVYGASTVTMQLVKNVFLRREKTLARKVQEVLLTWWLESVMPKRDILELYLNVIEYGPGVYGIRAAAMHYFGRTPAELGPAESAYLATILPNPKGFHSHWDADEIPASHRRRVARFLRTLGSRGRYDAAAVEEGLAAIETLRFHRPGLPITLAPRRRGGVGALPIETASVGLEPAEQGDEEEPEAFPEESGDPTESW